MTNSPHDGKDWDDKVDPWEPGNCYCVCHSRFSSRAYCTHCKGDNSVTRYHRLRQKIHRALLAIPDQKVTLAWGDWLDVASHVANTLTEGEEGSDDTLPTPPPPSTRKES